MITFVAGDMFADDSTIRVNTVNCVGKMGKGVALAFKDRYPDMFRYYKRCCAAGEVRPGKMNLWKLKDDAWIVNFPTKRHFREDSRYEDIEAGLDALRAFLAPLGKVKVSLPALGCGHGGLAWFRVQEMIKAKLSGLEAEIKVYSPQDSRTVK